MISYNHFSINEIYQILLPAKNMRRGGLSKSCDLEEVTDRLLMTSLQSLLPLSFFCSINNLLTDSYNQTHRGTFLYFPSSPSTQLHIEAPLLHEQGFSVPQPQSFWLRKYPNSYTITFNLQLYVFMEVVAAVSGIAGIVSLAGQILGGIVTLQGIFDSFSQASRTITKFISALKSLVDCVQEVKDLVLKLERASTYIAKSILSSLQIQLEDCSRDVCQWVKVASSSRPKSGKAESSFDSILKKFLIALKKDSFDGIFREIAGHKDNISIKLSVIGR
jgi:hypothetical protein